ncbi:MAG: alcohol dehydrogenase catalytic domain-containing protein [Spirochaetia bacterium]|jgi:threonine dehydrogenase-like Zn-dependent dehydrogenase
MRAAVFEGNGRLVLMERPEPKITKATDVLLRVQGVGICGTDLHILQVPPAHPARLGIIQGHEFTGEVVEVGAGVSEFSPGDQVLVDPHPGCGQCSYCRNGFPDQCSTLIAASGEPGHPGTIGIFSDGGFATHVLVPFYGLYKLRTRVPTHLAALAEPLACVLHSAGKLGVRPGDAVVVLGAGPIGCLFTAVLKAAGASRLIVSEPSAFRRERAQKCGATRVVDPTKEDLAKVVRDETGDGADFVVEAVGPLLVTAMQLARFGGTVLQFGHDELSEPKVPMKDIIKKELTIRGGFIGRYSFSRVARILESGELPLDVVVTHRIPLADVHKGIELLKKQLALKVVVEP